MKPTGHVVDRLRYRNHSGRLIRQHRALHTIRGGAQSWLHPVLLPLLFTGLLLIGMPYITWLWGRHLEFWNGVIALRGVVHTERHWFGPRLLYEVPYLQLAASPPDFLELSLNGILVCLLMLVSYLLLRRQHLPLVYMVWGLCLIHASALIYFALDTDFPYDIASHTRTGLEMNIALAFLTPWILAFTYYPFAFPMATKIGATVLLLFTLIVSAPFQYMAHAVIIYQFTLVTMPVLFIFGGLLLNVMSFVALYGWVMSWEQVDLSA